MRTDVTRQIVGVTVQAEDPPRMAARWADVLGLITAPGGGGSIDLELSGGRIRFVPVADACGEGISAVGFSATNAERALAAARARGLRPAERSVRIGGVRVDLE